MNDTDWDYAADNSDCDLLDDVTGEFGQNERDLAVLLNAHSHSHSHRPRGFSGFNLKTFSLKTCILAMTVVAVIGIAVWTMTRCSAKTLKLSTATETAPLLM